MDTYRALLAVVISFVILVGYQYFFGGFDSKKVGQEPAGISADVSAPMLPASPQTNQTSSPAKESIQQPLSPSIVPDRAAREILVDTDLYSAVITENGGAIKSFILKNYKDTPAKDSPA